MRINQEIILPCAVVESPFMRQSKFLYLKNEKKERIELIFLGAVTK